MDDDKTLLSYAVIPPQGFALAFSVDSRESLALKVSAIVAGLPTLPGLEIQPRPAHMMPMAHSDITLVQQRVEF